MVNKTGESFYVAFFKFVQYKNRTQYTGTHFCPIQLEKTGKSQCFAFFVVVVLRKLCSLFSLVYIYASCFYRDDCNVLP